jgi:hypothetical protein
MWDEVDPGLDAEGHLLCEGTGLDISGRNADAWPAALRAEVLERFPRLGLPAEFTAAFCTITGAPSTRTVVPSEVMRSVSGAVPSSGLPRTRALTRRPLRLKRADSTRHAPVVRLLVVETPGMSETTS